jgi:hypothetical protein
MNHRWHQELWEARGDGDAPPNLPPTMGQRWKHWGMMLLCCLPMIVLALLLLVDLW